MKVDLTDSEREQLYSIASANYMRFVETASSGVVLMPVDVEAMEFWRLLAEKMLSKPLEPNVAAVAIDYQKVARTYFDRACMYREKRPCGWIVSYNSMMDSARLYYMWARHCMDVR